MKTDQRCPGCGAVLPEDRLAGFCPACAWRELSEPELLEDAVVAALSPEVLLALPGHEVIGEIARGGMSVVYRARQLEPRREVALKMLLPHQQLSPEMGERFRVEIQAITSLDHPGILPLYQVGERAGMAFYTMKLASGGSLATRREHYRGEFREIAELIATLADAVQFAHERGVLHRDLKPGNILFDETGRPYVSDFGLAKIVTTDTDLTLSTTLLGTPSYLAPEVAAHSARKATTASDIYALGAMLYELLAGRPPFQAEGITALLKQIVEEEPLPPGRFATDDLRLASGQLGNSLQQDSRVEPLNQTTAATPSLPDAGGRRGPGRGGVEFLGKPLSPALSPLVPRGERETIRTCSVPRDLEVICLKCLAKEPARRYESAGALADDLRRWLAGEAIHARSVSAPEKLWLWARRHRATAAAVGLAVVLLLALVTGSTLSALRIAASRREALRTIEALETQKANDLLADGNTPEGIALLARRVRQDPDNWADCARLMWALHQRRWAMPVHAPYRPAELLHWDAVEIGQSLITGNDQRLLAVYVGTNLVVRDVVAGTNRHEWPLPFAPTRAAVLPSGLHELTDRNAHTWTCDPFTGRLLKHSATAEYHLGTSNLLVSPYGQMAFVVAPDYSGRLVDLQTGSTKTLVPADSSETGVSHYPTAAFFHGGRRIAFSDRGRVIRLAECETGELVGPSFTASQRVAHIGFSPDERVMVTRTQDEVQFWDLESGREFPGRPELSPNFKSGWFRQGSGAHCYLAGNPSGLVLFDVLTGQLSKMPPRGSLLPGDCYPDGRFVFVMFDRCIGVFHANTGEPLCEPVAHNPTQKGSARFIQDRLLTLGHDGLTVLWEVKTNRAATMVLRHAAGVQSARFSPDGQRVVTASHDGTAQIWDSHTGQAVGPSLVHRDKVWSASFSPDGRRVATASWDTSARIWDATSGVPLSPPLRASNYVFHVEFSPDGSRLLASGEDRVVRLYDGHTGQFVRALPQQGQVYWNQFSPDGRTIAMRPWGENPKLWDAETGELGRELKEPPASRIIAGVITRGEFSRDGQWLALGSPYRAATVWHLPEGRLHATLNHAAVVRTVRFSPDARTILTTADDLTARLWDARTGKPLSPPMAGRRRPGAHASGQSLRAGVIHPDGRRAVTGGSDAVLRVWDLRNGLSLGEAELNGAIMDAEFSPDGQRLLVACLDGSAHILTLPPVLDRAPDWLAPLAEGLVYQRFNADGAAENLSPTALWEACERLRRAPLDDPGVRWARDLLGF